MILRFINIKQFARDKTTINEYKKIFANLTSNSTCPSSIHVYLILFTAFAQSHTTVNYKIFTFTSFSFKHISSRFICYISDIHITFTHTTHFTWNNSISCLSSHNQWKKVNFIWETQFDHQNNHFLSHLWINYMYLSPLIMSIRSLGNAEV
jgi:hypothetical protein